MKFRKRSVEIEAHQFSPHKAWPEGVCRGCPADVRTPHVHTDRGPVNVHAGDWIVRGVLGEFYPVSPDVFAITFEAVEP